MYWLEEEDFLDCRSRDGYNKNRNPKEKFIHIFGNNLQIRPIWAIKITNGTTLSGELSYEPYYT